MALDQDRSVSVPAYCCDVHTVSVLYGHTVSVLYVHIVSVLYVDTVSVLYVDTKAFAVTVSC